MGRYVKLIIRQKIQFWSFYSGRSCPDSLFVIPYERMLVKIAKYNQVTNNNVVCFTCRVYNFLFFLACLCLIFVYMCYLTLVCGNSLVVQMAMDSMLCMERT